MKKVLLLSLLFVSMAAISKVSACDRSAFNLVGITDLGAGQYELTVEFCVGGAAGYPFAEQTGQLSAGADAGQEPRRPEDCIARQYIRVLCQNIGYCLLQSRWCVHCLFPVEW